mgnify:CR=1 FL=1
MEGLDGLRIALRELPDRIQSKVLQDAVAKGAVVVRNEARAGPLVDTGLLRRSIRSTRGKRRDSEASAFVSVRRLATGPRRCHQGRGSHAGRHRPGS